MKRLVSAAVASSGVALSIIYMVRPNEPFFWTPLPSITALLAGLPLVVVGGYGLVRVPVAGGAAKVKCWFCSGLIGAKEFDVRIARMFPGPRDYIAYPAHNQCAEDFVAGFATTEVWARVQKLHPELFEADGVETIRPPPAPPPTMEGPATHGPSGPAAPAPGGLTPDEEAVLAFLRNSKVPPMGESQTLLHAGVSKNKRHVLYRLQSKGLISITPGGGFPNPNLVRAVGEQR